MDLSVFGEIVQDTSSQRRTFFKLVFGEQARGWVCVSYKFPHDPKDVWKKHFFEWPQDLERMLADIDEQSKQLVHAYYCPSLYESPGKKNKEYVGTCTNIWADLDTCDPKFMLVPPSIVTETSPGKFHALWLLEDELKPETAEQISCKIAYYHAPQGADKSGWDLGQLLRIPYTPNYKYGDLKTAPVVGIIHAKKTLFRPSDFDAYPAVEPIKKYVELKMSDNLPNESAEDLLVRFNASREMRAVYEVTPTEDWSGPLWNLLRMCEEHGLREEEAFVVSWASACNKYRRDGRPETELWRDVNKAYLKRAEKRNMLPTSTATIPELMNMEEVKLVQSRETFVERYIKWASGVTDAAVQYHQSGAFIILSALLAGNIKLYTSFGTVIPNLWFMILGNTTITRKTTAMNIAMKILHSVDERSFMATDGSLEGILSGMANRPKQPSIFLRDEFTGLLEAIAHKEYMAGFAEQLTKLYDGEPLKRLLRKEVIDIKDPVFIMYVNGIKTKTQMMITDELVSGGFLPRFIIITADPDPSRIRPMGPPISLVDDGKEMVKNELIDVHNHYVRENRITQNGESIGRVATEYEAVLTPEAWARYNEFESLLIKTALEIGLDYLTPVYDRLAKSTLKVAILIAASIQRDKKVVVDVQDIIHGIYYARQWRAYSSEIINGVGKTFDERVMDRIYTSVAAAPFGMQRSEIMNMYHLDAKRADLILKTMEQRGLITLIEGAYRTYE